MKNEFKNIYLYSYRVGYGFDCEFFRIEFKNLVSYIFYWDYEIK